VLSGRGLCDELITRPEESYRLCCVIVCDLETSKIGAPYIYNVRLLRVKFIASRCVRVVSNINVWLVLTYSDQIFGTTKFFVPG